MNKAVLVRCDASRALGLGHVVRCIGLAGVLKDEHRRKVVFALQKDPLGIDLVKGAGFDVLPMDQEATVDYPGWLTTAIDSLNAGALVVDVRDGLTRQELVAVREHTGVNVAVIDDGSDRRLAADDVFYPPVPQVDRLEWSGFAGTLHVGWEWVLLRPEFAEEPVREANDVPGVLVSMGGTDPKGLTPKVMRSLRLAQTRLRCTVLAGAASADGAQGKALEEALDDLPHSCEVVRSGDVRELMLENDLAILAFGVTAYEAAACALPAIHLPLDDDHASSSSAFSDAGIAVTLGLADQVDEQQIADAVDGLLANPANLNAMGARARALVDGNGAARIAAVLAADTEET